MRYRALLLSFISAFLMPAFACAAAPTVASFTASPTSLSYAFGTQISWDIPNGGAPDFYFSCPVGITVKNNGAVVPCNTTTTLSSAASGAAGISIVNITGSTQSVSVRMTPKDTDGVAYSDSSQAVTLTVSPVFSPITSFSSSSTTPASGSVVTFSWTGMETPGVNLQFTCASDITILSDANNPLSTIPCGKPAFTTDLGQSGSQAVAFVNDSLFPEQMSVRVLPSVVAGTYDGTHGVSLTLSVAGKTIAPLASVSNFYVSNAAPVSGSQVTFSWALANADGANLQFSCASGVSVSSADSPTVPLQCGTPAFANDFGITGSTTVSFLNSGIAPVSLSVVILPKIGTTYDATRGRSIPISVQVTGAAVVNQPSAANTGGTSAALTPPSGQIKVVRTVTFTLAMQRGSRASQVSALQQLLAQDPSLYPEGLITGYFGVGTDAALKRFQVRYGIAKAGEPGYGTTGPKTRAKLNSLSYF